MIINTINGKESSTWHQCPTAVKNYLDNVTYDPSDYTTTQITTYAPSEAVSSNTKPIGNTVDGVTYYNEIPNAETPFSSTNTAGTVKPLDSLRWLNTATSNVRDLGGWSCDGGTVKYGMLIRGAEPAAADKALMVDRVGIRHELQLRGSAEAPQHYSLWDIQYTETSGYAMYSLSGTTSDTWKEMLRCVFDTVNKNVPLYFHCWEGADRTGTLACILEALLGMSQSDIDKDYELTNFYIRQDSTSPRFRCSSGWVGLINAIKAVPLEGGLTDSFRNRAVSFVLSLGFTIDEINAFRAAMIEGTPGTITASMDSYTVTKSGSNVTFDNTATTISQYQDYECNITADTGYVITGITVTHNGVDVTKNCFFGNFFAYGQIGITSNGTYDVTGKKDAVVNVQASGYSITKTLNQSSINNSQTTVISGQSYGAVITPQTNYSITGITVTMGGTDITSSCVALIEEA